LEAEALGYDSTLVAQHTANPYDDEWDELDAWTGAAALAALTSRIEIIAAIKPPLVHPVILAKMAMQIEHVSAGRFALNLVNAWNRAEYEKTGIPFAPHDERYAYGAEWAGLVERLLRGERVTHKGDYFDIADFQIRPADPYRARPLIYVGGESAPAQDLVAAHGDVWFINGQPLENVQALIASVRKLPRSGAPLRFGLSAFVIARETAGEAQAAYEHLVDLAHKDDEIRARQKQKRITMPSRVPRNNSANPPTSTIAAPMMNRWYTGSVAPSSEKRPARLAGGAMVNALSPQIIFVASAIT
jgi:alkanesulfonate monooxygenase